MKAVRPVIASNGFPSLQMGSVGPHSTSGRENEGNKKNNNQQQHQELVKFGSTLPETKPGTAGIEALLIFKEENSGIELESLVEHAVLKDPHIPNSIIYSTVG